MISLVITVLASAAVLTGAALMLLAGLGLHRFDNAYARMHASGKAGTLGAALLLIGAALAVPDGSTAGRLLLAVVFLFVTIPAAVHMLARAAHRAGSERGSLLVVDELAEDQERARPGGGQGAD